jgi:Flp pilus assembly pilin Flp
VVVTDRINRALVGLTQPMTQRGQGLAEYALILALIAIIAIVALLFLGGQTSKILSSLGKSI